MKKKVLVTGGAGMIGSHIVDLLCRMGYRVVVLDNLDPTVHGFRRPDWINPHAEFICGDISDFQSCKVAVEDVECIFHNAAYGGFTDEDNKVIRTNCLGITQLMRAVRLTHAPVSHIIAASSQAVYGECKYMCTHCGIQFRGSLRNIGRLQSEIWEIPCPQCGYDAIGIPLSETDHVLPTGTYSSSKYFMERILESECKSMDIPYAILRYCLTFGPRQSMSNPYCGIASLFTKNILSGQPVRVFEDGQQTRSFNDVRDVAAANIQVFLNDLTGTYNVGNGEFDSINEFVLGLYKFYGKTPNIQYGGFRQLDLRHLSATSLLTSIGAWKPMFGFFESIENYAQWGGDYYRQHQD